MFAVSDISIYERIPDMRARYLRRQSQTKEIHTMLLKALIVLTVGFILLMVIALWRSAARYSDRELSDKEQIAYMQAWRGKHG